MVKNRQEIRRIDFAAPAGVPPAFEVLTLAQVRARTSTGPQRPTFHQLLTIERGTLGHTVDFERYVITPGDWLWVRPGQVQQWEDLTGVDGTLILFEPEFLDRTTDDSRTRYVGDDRLNREAAHLASVFADPGRLPLEVRQSVLRHLLAALTLQLVHLAPTGSKESPTGTFLRFRDAVERDFARVHRLEDYARTLGYSARTLSRATQAAAGVNGKDYIDRRIVLEAKRLLAHGDLTAAQIAARLGFSSATNFSKYFSLRAGVAPLTFRRAANSG